MNDLASVEREVESLAAAVDCLTARQICLIADITPGTLETHVKRGTAPPSVLYGRRRLFPRALFRQWLDARIGQRLAKASAL